jgi:hypothetical protein
MEDPKEDQLGYAGHNHLHLPFLDGEFFQRHILLLSTWEFTKGDGDACFPVVCHGGHVPMHFINHR